jgi:hypothetical protein
MKKKLMIIDSEGLEETKRKIREQGFDSIHVITDFDRTLTKAFVNGERTPSIISQLYDGNH